MRWIILTVGLCCCLIISSITFAQQRPQVPGNKNTQPSQNEDPAGKPKKLITKVIPIDGDLEPVKITCQSFEQDDDWLKDLTIEIENISDKPIKYLECNTLICDIKGENCIVIPLVYGKVVSKSVSLDDISAPTTTRVPEGIYSKQYPSTADQRPRKGNKKQSEEPLEPAKPIETPTAPIPAGQKIKLRITESAYKNAKQLVEQFTPLASINSADLIIAQVHFTDGSGWANESLLPGNTLGKYKTGNNSYLVAKGAYAWGYLRDRTNTYGDIYAGPAAVEDEKGGKSRVQGYNRNVASSKRVIVFSSGGG